MKMLGTSAASTSAFTISFYFVVVVRALRALWANAGTRQGRGFETRNAAYLMRPWQAETGNMLNHRSRQGICSSMGDSVS